MILEEIKKLVETVDVHGIQYDLSLNSASDYIYASPRYPKTKLLPLEGESVLIPLLNEVLHDCSLTTFTDQNKIGYCPFSASERFARNIRESFIKLWMAVNGKKEYNRTKLRKILSKATDQKIFIDAIVELYKDTLEYKVLEKPLPKQKKDANALQVFFASKFYELGEKYGS